INKDEFHINKDEILDAIRKGAVFIYPTDTIYGIGADALNKEAVKRIRKAKERYTRPFSVIAPSKEWIKENCEISKEAEKWIKRLPGPYTLILKLKNKGAVHPSVNSDMETIGIRIPGHWCSEIATALNTPIITTSANITNKTFMTNLENIDNSLKNKMDFIIYEGVLKGKPSKIIELTKEKTEIIKR
ncbi:MAG: threonylcarbamoyl-AMP synthase, partial [Nanoarchaeota archaeon]|nr:threonylcarbamoyl-AMP synthase [Nanoarchaeota archaeon]